MTDVPMRFGAVLSLVLSLVWLPATGRIEFPGATPTLDRPNGRRRHQFSAGLDRSARDLSCGARVPYRRLHTEVPEQSCGDCGGKIRHRNARHSAFQRPGRSPGASSQIRWN